jgi:hypothetical protein
MGLMEGYIDYFDVVITCPLEDNEMMCKFLAYTSFLFDALLLLFSFKPHKTWGQLF